MKGPKANDRRSPLPRRTGHGDFPHPALARVVSSRKHSQTQQSQMVQMSIDTDALTGAPTSLAATLQMSPQARTHERIEFMKRLARIAQLEIVGPASQMPIHPPNQLRDRRVTLMRSGSLTHRFPFPLPRFARGLPVPVTMSPTMPVSVQPKGVAQKIQALTGLLQVQCPGLFPVDPQVQPAFQFALNPVPQLRTDITSHDHYVIRVANQLRFVPRFRPTASLQEG